MRAQNDTDPVLLGFESGATRTVILVAGADRRELRFRQELGPGNFRLLGAKELLRHLRQIASFCHCPVALGAGMAGVRTREDRAALLAALNEVWPGVPAWAGNDLETALAADADAASGTQRILVLSGTGSCCYGVAGSGDTAKCGGWGHQLGDRGSAYAIAIGALRAALISLDRAGHWPKVGSRCLRTLSLNSPDELVGWIQSADKPAIAALAVEVFAAARCGDRIARRVLADASGELAGDAVACAQRLGIRNTPARFVFAGSVVTRQPAFRNAIMKRIRAAIPGSRAAVLQRDSAWGAIELAAKLGSQAPATSMPKKFSGKLPMPTAPDVPSALSPTEARNPLSMNLDRLSLDNAVALMLREEATVSGSIGAQKAKVVKLIRWVVDALRSGGRLLYVGAGTSGRLGILDASECPPTFGSDPDQVQGIIAGGRRAIWEAVEGSEDDRDAGAEGVLGRGVSKRDVVLGIAASGRTPFVLGALAHARTQGARTALLTFNPGVRFRADDRPELLIAVETGPEVLTGSTRLKAGTATKIVLNTITTLAMAKLGKVIGNLMVDVKASNTKLRGRAVRILSALTGETEDDAQTRLGRNGWKVQAAWSDWKREKRSA